MLKNKVQKKYIEDKDERIFLVSIGDMKIVDFQLNMINNNASKGLVSVEKYEVDDGISLKYDVSKYDSLHEYIKSNEVDKELFKAILKQIKSIISRCPDLLLEGSNFVLEKEAIFISKKNLGIKLVNVPLVSAYNENIDQSYLSFVSDIIKELLIASNIEEGSLEFIIKVNKFLGDKCISIDELMEFIDLPEPKVSQKPAMQKQPQPQPQPNMSKPRPIQKSTKQKLKYETWRLVTTIILQPAIICIMLMLLTMDNIDMPKVLIGCAVAIIVDVAAIVLLLNPAKKVPMVSKEQHNQNQNKNQSINPQNTNSRHRPANNFRTSDNATTYLGDETSILVEHNGYLESASGENVEINSDNFIIGRQANLQKWVNTTNVGRQHARIINNQGTYYLEDLASKNGTKLNGIKLNTHEGKILRDGDVIEFADLRVKFKTY
ncbi:MAG: DUF6382 domain-containing protein [Peptostreptococcaceae bacterium]